MLKTKIIAAAVFSFLIVTVMRADELPIKVSSLESWDNPDEMKIEKNADGITLHGVGRLVSKESFELKGGSWIALNLHFKTDKSFNVGIYEYDQNGTLLGSSTPTILAKGSGFNSVTRYVESLKPQTVKARIVINKSQPDPLSIKSILPYRLNDDEQNMLSARRGEEAWKKAVSSENAALGKKVRFVPDSFGGSTAKLTPMQRSAMLTDGKLCPVGDKEMLYLYTRNKAPGNIIIIDLEKVQPVKKFFMRIRGGKASGVWGVFPSQITVYASKDGKKYYQAAALKKLADPEKEFSDWKNYYWLPACSDPYRLFIAIFPFEINADARFIAVDIPGPILFTDEIAAILADSKDRKEGFNQIYKKGPDPVFMSQYPVFRPHEDAFYVGNGLFFQHKFLFADSNPMTPDGQYKTGFSYLMDFPEQIEYAPHKDNPYWDKSRILGRTEKKNGRVIYHFTPPEKFYKGMCHLASMGLIGPYYFRANGKIKEDQKYAVFTTFFNGKKQYSHKVPVKVLDFSKSAKFRKITLGIWFSQKSFTQWPGFLKSMEGAGINCLGGFPGVAGRKNTAGQNSEKDKTGCGMKYQGGLSCIGEIRKFAQSENNVSEILCTGRQPSFGGNKIHQKNYSICPSYRGKYYQMFCDKLRKIAEDGQIDNFSFDDEQWMHGVPETIDVWKDCKRCDALRKSWNVDWKTFFSRVQADFFKGFVVAIRQGGKGKVRINHYDVYPGFFMPSSEGPIPYNGYDFLYPEFMDEVSPAHYSPDTGVLRKLLFNVVKQAPKLPLAPYISAGMGAYNNLHYGKNSEAQILESLMFGAHTVYIYHTHSMFSAGDYYRIAKAASLMAPLEEFLLNSKLDMDFKGSNEKLTYTARRSERETVVLVGAYSSPQDLETVFSLPRKAQVYDLESGKKLSKGFFSNDLKITIPAGGFRLLKIIGL